MVYFRFKILLMLGGQYDPSPAEMFQGGMTEWGGIYSCSRVLCRTTGCRPYHTAVWITRFALMCTATEVTKPRGTMSPTPPKCLCQGSVQPQLGKASRPTQGEQQDTRRGPNCANRAVYTFSRFGRESEQKHEEQNPKLPGRAGCWLCPRTTRTHTRSWHTAGHTDGRTRAHTAPHGAHEVRTAPLFSDTTPERTPRQQTVHPERDNTAIHRCILHYGPDGSRRKDILHSGWSRSHRPKTANINRKLYLIL